MGADAHKAQADLQAAQEQKGKMFITNSKLSQVTALPLQRFCSSGMCWHCLELQRGNDDAHNVAPQAT